MYFCQMSKTKTDNYSFIAVFFELIYRINILFYRKNITFKGVLLLRWMECEIIFIQNEYNSQKKKNSSKVMPVKHICASMMERLHKLSKTLVVSIDRCGGVVV